MSFLTFLQKKFGFFKDNNLENNNSVVSNDLSNLTVVKLKSLAKERGLSGYSKLKKAELVRLLS